MSWDDFRYLLAIDRGGGVAGAAREMGVDKATVRRRIDALEEEFGQPLVERSATGWSLSDAGARVASAARVMDDAVRAARRDVAEAGGHAIVRVTAPIWFARRVITPELGAFRARHSEITLRLLATDAILDVAKWEADIAIRNFKPESESLAFRRIGMLGLGIYASRDYVEARGFPPSRADWSGHDLLANDQVFANIPGLQWLGETGAEVALRASDPLVVLDAARSGLGIGVLPCFLGDSDPRLVRAWREVVRQPIYACLPKQLRDHAPVRLVADWLADLFAHKDAELAG